MKYHRIRDLPNGNNSHKKPIFLILFFVTLTTFPFFLRKIAPQVSLAGDPGQKKKACNLFNGTWVPHSGGPYYTNETCSLIIDQQNCLKFGRPDTEFLKWRWKPDECELPLFNATQFLDLVRGKSLAFLGDSVGKNQMHSLLCLLTQVSYPEDVSEKYYNDTTYFRRYIFREHNFTVGTLWAPFLVRSHESDPNGYSANSQMNLFIDEPDQAWSAEVETFDYVVVSAGQWFFRPLTLLHRNLSLAGCSNCGREDNNNNNKATDLTPFYVYRRAFRTAFRTLLGLESYKGVTVLRTFSPSHFENGAWNEGGSCVRTKPFGREAMAEWYVREMRRVQVEEFVEAREMGSKRGLEFRVMDTTEAMFRRPDGHPNFYGRSPHRNTTFADCVHWCLPGPIDAWNEFLLHILREFA